MENITTVRFFNLRGLQKTWMNTSVYFPLTLVTYLLIITGNLTLIITIFLVKSLHEPMYIFIFILSINSLYGTVGFYPMILSYLLSDNFVISYGACFTQAYVIYFYVMGEITILSVMAFDRYVAIFRPLHYHMLMSPLNVGRLLLFAWFCPGILITVAMVLTLRLPLCGSTIDKVFCDNSSVLQHSCVAITMNQIWSVIMVTIYVLQIVLIIYSYFQIIRICLISAEGRIKFTQTCVPHLSTIIILIIATLFDILYGWYGNASAPLTTRNAMAVQFLVIPPLFNPIIYGLNLKKIRRVIFNKCRRKSIC